MENRQRKAGYVVVTYGKVMEAHALPTGTSAQKAELSALTRALELSQDRRLSIYTDSTHAFMLEHAHGAIWKERGLLTLGNRH